MNSLNLYHIFYTAAKCGSISEAAKQLYISQPAVSKAVSRLEANFASPLLTRGSRGVSLTENGQILYSKLDTAFQAIRSGEEQLRKNEALGVETLSIGVSTTLCKYILLPHLREFIRENPHVKISIFCQSTYETIAALENGAVDIGLVGEPDRPGSSVFHPIRTITDVFVAAGAYLDRLREAARAEMAEGSPLREMTGDPSPDQLTENALLSHATLLLLVKNNITRQYIDKYLILQDFAIGQQLEVTTMDLLIDFAKTGLGIACVIRDFVEKELKEGSLVIFPTREPIPSRRIGWCLPKNGRITPAMDRLIKKLES